MTNANRAEVLASASGSGPHFLPAGEPQHRTMGVNVLGHFRYPSGVGEAALATVHALRSSGVEVACRDVPVEGAADVSGTEKFADDETFDISILHLQPGPLFDSSYERAELKPRADVYRIGVWYWELDTVPEEWLAQSRMLDEVWAPTKFIAEALAKVLPIPVVEMLPGVPRPYVEIASRAYFGLPEDHFTYLFMFDMRSTFERKNPIGLVRAFRRAFEPAEKVTLAIKVSRGEHDPTAMAELRREAAGANVRIIERGMSRGESYGLIAACDGFASLHRSEGFGLCLAEAMYLGKPVIATGYSGNLDFMSRDFSLLVDFETVELEKDHLPYRKGRRWADPSISHAANSMRWVVDHPAESQAMAERGRAATERTLSMERAGRAMLERIEAIRRLPKPVGRAPQPFRFRRPGEPQGPLAAFATKLGRYVRYYGLRTTIQRALEQLVRFASRR